MNEILPDGILRNGLKDKYTNHNGDMYNQGKANKKIAKTHHKKSQTYSFLPQRFHKKTFLKWLRRTHAWCGFWGATIALLFGVSGIVLNHRGGDLKIDLAKTTVNKAQFTVSPDDFSEITDLGIWIQAKFKLQDKDFRTRIVKGRTVAFDHQEVILPAEWQVGFQGPDRQIRATYLVGSNMMEVSIFDNDFLAMLNSLHKGNDLSVGWVLLADAIAGALIMLCLTGMLLWTKLHGRRMVALFLFSGAMVTAVMLVVPTMIGQVG